MTNRHMSLINPDPVVTPASKSHRVGTSNHHEGSGEIPMVGNSHTPDPMSATVARRQAGRLRMLAQHLEAHPRLAAVRVEMAPRGDFLVVTGWESDPQWYAAALRRWAISIGAPTASVSMVDGRLRVHVRGRSVMGRAMSVSTVIDGFAAALDTDQVGLLAWFGTCSVPLSTLADFAGKAVNR